MYMELKYKIKIHVKTCLSCCKPNEKICKDFSMHDNYENFFNFKCQKTYLNRNYPDIQKYLYCLLTEHTSIISRLAISLSYSPTVFGTYSLCHMRYTCTVMLTYIIWDIHVLWCIAYVIWVVYVVCTIFKILHAYFLQTSFIKIQIILIISPCWKIFNII